MRSAPLKPSPRGIILLAAILSCVVVSCVALALADDKSADKYNETGTVLSATSKHGYFYQVSTDGRIYLLLCEHTGTLHLGAAECKVGGKFIAAGDVIHLRIDGDWAYTAASSTGTEDKFRILTTELKVIPPLPPATTAAVAPTPNSKASTTSGEQGIVIGTGVQVKGQHGVGWSTTPAVLPIQAASAATPVMSMAPVMAVPVTGGAPVIVVPTAPTTGGVVTGVPVTGGAPITAIPTAPVMGMPLGGAPAGGGMVIGGGSAPQWEHVLRIHTAGRTYQLECSSKPCSIARKDVALGDTITFRVDKKWAYLSTSAPGVSPDPRDEEKYKILSATVDPDPTDTKAPDTKPTDPATTAAKPQ